jgi:hypothetical protein
MSALKEDLANAGSQLLGTRAVPPLPRNDNGDPPLQAETFVAGTALLEMDANLAALSLTEDLLIEIQIEKLERGLAVLLHFPLLTVILAGPVRRRQGLP